MLQKADVWLLFEPELQALLSKSENVSERNLCSVSGPSQAHQQTTCQLQIRNQLQLQHLILKPCSGVYSGYAPKAQSQIGKPARHVFWTCFLSSKVLHAQSLLPTGLKYVNFHVSLATSTMQTLGGIWNLYRVYLHKALYIKSTRWPGSTGLFPYLKGFPTEYVFLASLHTCSPQMLLLLNPWGNNWGGGIQGSNKGENTRLHRWKSFQLWKLCDAFNPMCKPQDSVHIHTASQMYA